MPAAMSTTTTTPATAPPPLLDYRSAPAGAPSEFDLELASERTRWIRRRFLWFCGINILITLGLLGVLARNIAASPPLARWLNVVDFTILLCAYGGAMAYVWRRRQFPLADLLRLGLWLTAILPLVSIVFTRLDMTLNRGGYDDLGGRFSPGALWAMTAPWSIFVDYTIACLFIPWTMREALRPAAVLLVANALIVTGDLIFSIRQPGARLISVACLAASPLSILPGLLICWWRFSRFRKRFRLTFESLGYRKLQTELAGARRLHESSLPPANLHTSGPVRLAYAYEPMRQIGGDILYVHPTDPPDAARVSVVLIDVNGHGIAAALMANRVIGETQRLFAENPDASPDQILCALNRYVRLTMAKDSVFATALVLRVDAVAGTLEYANGGHPPALLRRAGEGEWVRLNPDTYLLGVHDGEDYCPDCHRLAFGPGDALLAYTDGATEARNPSGEMLTMGGLQGLLAQLAGVTPPERWPQALLHLVVTHRRAPAADDTLLVSVLRV
jgi:serine phosphatase RsbU (regulator of sigma subunit)